MRWKLGKWIKPLKTKYATPILTKKKMSKCKFFISSQLIWSRILIRYKIQNNSVLIGYRCRNNLMKILRGMVLPLAEKQRNNYSLKFNFNQSSLLAMYLISKNHRQINNTRNQSKYRMLHSSKTVNFFKNSCKRKRASRQSHHWMLLLNQQQRLIACHQKHRCQTRIAKWHNLSSSLASNTPPRNMSLISLMKL